MTSLADLGVWGEDRNLHGIDWIWNSCEAGQRKCLKWLSSGKEWPKNLVCFKLMDRTELNYQRIGEKYCVLAIRGWAPRLLSGRKSWATWPTGWGWDQASVRLSLLVHLPLRSQLTGPPLSTTSFSMKLLSPKLPVTFLPLNSRGRLQCLLSLTFEHLSLLIHETTPNLGFCAAQASCFSSHCLPAFFLASISVSD